MTSLRPILIAVLSIQIACVLCATASAQDAVPNESRTNLIPEKIKLLETVKNLADQEEELTLEKVQKELGVKFTATDITDKNQSCCQAGYKEYPAELNNFWFTSLPNQMKKRQLSASFFVYTPGQIVDVIPAIVLCESKPKSNSRPARYLMFRDIMGYQCIDEKDLKQFSNKFEPVLATDGADIHRYLGNKNENWGSTIEFSGWNGCLSTAKIEQSEENGNHYKKTHINYRKCKLAARKTFCAEHKGYGKRTDENKGIIDRTLMSDFLNKACGTFEDSYKNEPFDESIPVPQFSIPAANQELSEPCPE